MTKGNFFEHIIPYFITFLIGIVIANYLTKSVISVSNLILFCLFFGLIIELCSKIMQYFVFERKIRFRLGYSIHFLFWVIIQSIVFWIGFSIAKNISWVDLLIIFGRFGLYDNYLRILFIVIIQIILVRVVGYLDIEHKLIPYGNNKRNLLILFIILALLVGCIYYSDKNILNKIKTLGQQDNSLSNYVEIPLLQISCKDLEDSISSMVTDMKETSCYISCSERGFVYKTYKCKSDRLFCYCSPK